jgi:hypothetical protein
MDDISVTQLNVGRCCISLEGERVLHPLLIVTLRVVARVSEPGTKHYDDQMTCLGEIFTGVGTSGLFASGCSLDSLNSTLQDVTKLKGLHEVTERCLTQRRSCGLQQVLTSSR